MAAETKQEDTKKDEKKLIVISGITSGIGAGMLRQFTKMGYIAAGFGRRQENIAALRKELNITDDLLLTSLDITDHSKVQTWGASLVAKYGAPFMVIHNAASTKGCNKDTWEIDLKDLQTSLMIHIGGSVLLSKCFLPGMRELNRGVFINVSSWAARNAFPGGTPYVASKFGIEGLAQCLAKELDDVNPDNAIVACCISPGFVKTEMLKGSVEEQVPNVENGDEWAQKNCAWILSLNDAKKQYHGKSVGCPSEKESITKYVDFFKNNFGIEMELQNYLHEAGVKSVNKK